MIDTSTSSRLTASGTAVEGTLGGVIEVEVRGLGADTANEPVLVLQERGGRRRCLPIWVGGPEAIMLRGETEGVVAARPLTDRLLLDVLDAFAVALERVRITALVAGQFHAELDLARSRPTGAGGAGAVSVSARASDAVLLALGRGCVIEVDEAVLDEAALPAARVATAEVAAAAEPQTPVVDPVAIDDEVERLRRALDQAGPEDFGRPGTDPDDDTPDGPD